LKAALMGAIGNGAGLPAISVPNGFSEKGLPTGMQFMGRADDENLIIAVARAYQHRTEWHLAHPPDLVA
jgi:aspartyl-tRNA(Asn)/glutamyl-tRNA(Gln) amidotransferase subunit A